LIFPYFNPRYGPILSGRYLIPLLPFAYLGVALALVHLTELFKPRHRLVPLAVRVTATTLAVCIPLIHLGFYYGEVLADDRVNQPLFTLADTLEESRQAGELVLLDEGLAQESLTAGGTDLKALRVLLESRSIPYEVEKLTVDNLEPILTAQPRVLAIMEVKKVDRIEPRVTVTRYGHSVESSSGSEHRYRVYGFQLPEEPAAPAQVTP
jgi:hypothetical protein